MPNRRTIGERPSDYAAGADCGDVWIERNTVQDIGLFAYCGVYNNGLVPNGICSTPSARHPAGDCPAPHDWHLRECAVHLGAQQRSHYVPYSWCVTFNHYLYGMQVHEQYR